MNKFEAVILYSPDLSNSNLKNIEDSFQKNIVQRKGVIIGEEDWGLRDLSYNIKNNKKAFYKFYQLEVEGKEIQDIKKNLSQNEKIIRHLFIKVNTHHKLPTKLNNEEKEK